MTDFDEELQYAIPLDSELLDKDFDEIDLYGERMEDDNDFETDILFE